MSVKRIEVKTFQERLYCDGCGGEMFPTGHCFSNSPPTYSHKCEKCGRGEGVDGFTYPRTVVEEIIPESTTARSCHTAVYLRDLIRTPQGRDELKELTDKYGHESIMKSLHGDHIPGKV